MPQAPFPDPGPDDAEPDGFPLDEDAPGPEQGLYITLPAGQLTLAGFCQGGASDTMAPGALLAAVVDTVTGEDGAGLAGCSDDQLLGIISAARRLESRTATRRRAAPTSPSPVVRVSVLTRRPAPGRRITCAARAAGWSRSPAATATTPGPSPSTGPAANSGTWSAPAAPGAPRRVAAGPRPAVTWTIPSRGTRAASPANVTSPLCAGTTTNANKVTDGRWSSRNRES